MEAKSPDLLSLCDLDRGASLSESAGEMWRKFFIFILTSAVAMAEVTLESLTEGLDAEDFASREAATLKIETWAKANPEKALSQIPQLLKKGLDPESDLRLQAIARSLHGPTKKAYFGFSWGSQPTVIEDKIVLGLVIGRVVPGTAAAKGGLMPRDMIMAVNGKNFPPETSRDEVMRRFAKQTPGKNTELLVKRGQQMITLNISPNAVDLTAEERADYDADFEEWLAGELKK